MRCRATSGRPCARRRSTTSTNCARGKLLATHALQSVHASTTVRVRQGRVSTTDGPFAETKETLGGFFLIEAPDLDAAIAIAARWPSARIGSIEVRPIEEALRPEGRYATNVA